MYHNILKDSVLMKLFYINLDAAGTSSGNRGQKRKVTRAMTTKYSRQPPKRVKVPKARDILDRVNAIRNRRVDTCYVCHIKYTDVSVEQNPWVACEKVKQ